MGIVHGLASNDELLVLLVVSLGVDSAPLLLVGVGLFTVGVVLGMLIFGFAITYPTLRWSGEKTRKFVNVGVGAMSIAYGIVLLVGLFGLGAGI